MLSNNIPKNPIGTFIKSIYEHCPDLTDQTQVSVYLQTILTVISPLQAALDAAVLAADVRVCCR